MNTVPRKVLTVGSLFSGSGLLDYGLEQAGLETIWQVEKDDWCREVALPQNFPNTEKFKDVREVGKHNLKPVDVICGGFPCQKISKVNTQKFTVDESLELWFEQFRIISELLPKIALIENSPELVRKGLWRILSDLASIGYDAEWQIIQASDTGLPHERARIFLVSYPESKRFESDDFSIKAILKACLANTDTFRRSVERMVFILKLTDISIHRYPNIYEWMMGLPTNFLKLKRRSKPTETESPFRSANGSENK